MGGIYAEDGLRRDPLFLERFIDCLSEKIELFRQKRLETLNRLASQKFHALKEEQERCEKEFKQALVGIFQDVCSITGDYAIIKGEDFLDVKFIESAFSRIREVATKIISAENHLKNDWGFISELVFDPQLRNPFDFFYNKYSQPSEISNKRLVPLVKVTVTHFFTTAELLGAHAHPKLSKKIEGWLFSDFSECDIFKDHDAWVFWRQVVCGKDSFLIK